MPFLIAYFQFGFIAATWTLIATIAVRKLVWRRPHDQSGITDTNRLKTGLKGGLTLVTLGLAAATLFTGEVLFLQLIPTVLSPVIGVAVVYFINKEKAFYAVDIADPEFQRIFSHIRWILGIVGFCSLLDAAAWNEYLWTNFALDTWVWFFSYF